MHVPTKHRHYGYLPHVTWSWGTWNRRSSQLWSGLFHRLEKYLTSRPPFIFHSKNLVRRHKHSFQAKWFSKWPWLYYNKDNHSVYCFHCIRAYSQNKLLGVLNLEKAYISTGFTNWKEATSRFTSDEGNRSHKDALLKMVILPATTCDIVECLSKQHLKVKFEHWQCFLKLLANVKFLSRQGLPFRGSGDGSDTHRLTVFGTFTSKDT